MIYFENDKLKEIEKTISLHARTREFSPCEIEWATSLLSNLGVAIDGAKWLIGIIRNAKFEREQQRLAWRMHFSFTRNSEFLVGKNADWCDDSVLESLLKITIASFDKTPQRGKSLSSNSVIEWGFNLISIGGPEVNNFSKEALEILTEFPYRFKEKKVKKNDWILEPREAKVPYPYLEPEMYKKNGDEYVYKNDYSMVVRADSPIAEAKERKRQILIIAGCHRVGTGGAAQAIQETENLDKIWNKVRDGAFQAIFRTDVDWSGPEPSALNTVLIDVIPGRNTLPFSKVI